MQTLKIGVWGPAAVKEKKPASPSDSGRNGGKPESSWKSTLHVYVYKEKHIPT